MLMSATGTWVKQAVAVLADWPAKGLTAFSTVGLCDRGGYEIASMSSSRNRSFIKVVFDAAALVAEGHRRAEPGATFEKIVSRYYTRCNTGHLFLSQRSPPGLALPAVRTESGGARWLFAWPITSDELIALGSRGARELEADLDRIGVDALGDLARAIGGGGQNE